MSESAEHANLPAQVAEAFVAIPKALVPAALKALDRLVGAAVDVPVAWLRQKSARIDAQTEAYKLVEASIAKAASSEAAADEVTVRRAVDVLVRKAYRKQANREGVAIAMLEDLSASPEENISESNPATAIDVDDDWLNVFERYAEDASSDRMQKLWGRVLAGEIRRRGRFSIRTLRFLSEFSQADALTFEDFSRNVFGDTAPKKLAQPENKADIRDLIYLEANGILQGVTGFGLSHTLDFDRDGYAHLREGNLAIIFRGAPNTKVSHTVIVLTPLGQELISLLPSRDARAAAKAVAFAMRKPEFEEAYLGILGPSGTEVVTTEVLWLK